MKNRLTNPRIIGRGAATVLAMLALILTLSSMSATAAPAAPDNKPAAPADPQYFQDIAPGSFFYPFTAALYTQGVVSGYTCGTPPAGACVPPGNLPYYVPNINVTRGLMSIYIDHARTKPGIAVTDAGLVGGATYDIKLTNSTPSADTLLINASGTGNYGINVRSNDSDAMDAYGAAWGVYVRNTGGNPAVDAGSSGASSYAGYFNSTAYRGVLISNPNMGYNNLRVDGQAGNTHTAADILGGNLIVENDLIVNGSKTGYVVDIMKNAGGEALEPGDVVVVADNSSDAVLGQIPVPSIRKADKANDSAVVGIVDAPLYVPDAATRTAYAQQQQADREAAAAAQAQVLDQGGKNKLSPMANIKNRISDDAGTIHRSTNTTSIDAGGYANVVTLGSYKAVKVDASFGAIHPGDLLTTSPHAGYAMVVKDKAAASGAVIGKALSGLDSGTGTVTVMVTLK